MASFSVILSLACIVSFLVIMSGGKYKRETGWPFVGALLTLVAVVEIVIVSIVVCGFPRAAGTYLSFNRKRLTLIGVPL